MPHIGKFNAMIDDTEVSDRGSPSSDTSYHLLTFWHGLGFEANAITKSLLAFGGSLLNDFASRKL